MKKSEEFTITFGGLKAGNYSYEFRLNKRFLDMFGYEGISNADIGLEVYLKKSSRLLEFDFILKGTATVECDRCLDDLDIPVDYSSRLIVKLENTTDFEDDIIFMKPDSTEINISKYVYENIVFSLPARKIHPEDKNGKSLCNPQMLEKLGKYLIPESHTTANKHFGSLKEIVKLN